MSDNGVLLFDLKLKKQRMRGVKYNGYNRCRHSQMLADEHNKVLECASCGYVINPWDYIWEMAKKEEGLYDHLKYAKMERISLDDQLKELKRKISNAKAQLRRTNKSA